MGVDSPSSATRNTLSTWFSLKPVTDPVSKSLSATVFAVSAVTTIAPFFKIVVVPYALVYCVWSCAGVGGVGLLPATT